MRDHLLDLISQVDLQVKGNPQEMFEKSNAEQVPLMGTENSEKDKPRQTKTPTITPGKTPANIPSKTPRKTPPNITPKMQQGAHKITEPVPLTPIIDDITEILEKQQPEEEELLRLEGEGEKQTRDEM